MKIGVLVLPAFLALVACDGEPVSVSLMDVRDGVARFSVENRSALDVRSAGFEVVYEEAGEAGHRADTVRYEVTRDSSGEVPFVRAGDVTFFPHRLPDGASDPTARVITVEFWDGTTWGGS